MANEEDSNPMAQKYQMIITAEEKEALSRSSDKDSEIFFATANLIRKNMIEMSELKSSNDPNAKADLKELKIETALAFMELKKLNRMEKFRTKSSRDALITAKTSVDNKNLQLQNLFYEVMHLQKEVTKCLQFKSRDESINLVSEEEFFKNAPESISRPEITKNDPHLKRLAQLEWELVQRKQLAAETNNFAENKKNILINIESNQARLDNLLPQLKTILEASKPLQESLSLPLEKIKLEHQKASLLPRPLYNLYAKAVGYRDAFDNTLIVSIEGDEEEAKQINDKEIVQDSDSETDGLNENTIEETHIHKKRHRVLKENKEEEKKTRLLQKYPLSVKLVISFKNDTTMKLQFYYMTNLEIITVDSDLLTVNLGGISVGDMLIPESVLCELYPRDIGNASPNPANVLRMQKFKLNNFSTLGLGLPYRWAQRLAGLRFIPLDYDDKKSLEETEKQESIENVIKQIKRRVKARLDLCAEIRQLESGNLSVSKDVTDPVPEKVSSILHKFMISSWKNYSQSFDTKGFCNDLISSSDVFYEAILKRGNDELHVFIVIKPDYPKVSAILRIKLNSNSNYMADILRNIEREVNVMWENPPTLSAQLQRLRSCFDIYLETEGLTAREKIFFHPIQGRSRSRPYKYVELGSGIFTHR